MADGGWVGLMRQVCVRRYFVGGGCTLESGWLNNFQRQAAVMKEPLKEGVAILRRAGQGGLQVLDFPLASYVPMYSP